MSNSVAIQTGTDPVAASIRFYWGRAADGSPSRVRSRRRRGAALVRERCARRRLAGLFLNQVRSAPTGLGFKSVGWVAWMVENPDAEPSAWRRRQLPTRTNPPGVLVGFAAVLHLDEHVYAFGSEDPVSCTRFMPHGGRSRKFVRATCFTRSGGQATASDGCPSPRSACAGRSSRTDSRS